MLRQDLAGYALLGDPAIRLPILGGREAASAPRAGERHPRCACLGGGTRGGRRARGPPGEPVPDVARRHGFDHAELGRYVASFCAAGRAALEAAVRRAPDQGP